MAPLRKLGSLQERPTEGLMETKSTTVASPPIGSILSPNVKFGFTVLRCSHCVFGGNFNLPVCFKQMTNQNQITKTANLFYGAEKKLEMKVCNVSVFLATVCITPSSQSSMLHQGKYRAEQTNVSAAVQAHNRCSNPDVECPLLVPSANNPSVQCTTLCR